jgi:hypothetical protein
MKKIILGIFFLQLTSPLFAKDMYAICGERPSVLDRLIEMATKAHSKCVEDIYETNKRKTEAHIDALNAKNAELTKKIKKVAYEMSIGVVRCQSINGEKADFSRSQKCHEIVEQKRMISQQLERLNGWVDKSEKDVLNQKDPKSKELSPPCPSKEELQKMKMAIAFNGKLYNFYNDCVLQTNY